MLSWYTVAVVDCVVKSCWKLLAHGKTTKGMLAPPAPQLFGASWGAPLEETAKPNASGGDALW